MVIEQRVRKDQVGEKWTFDRLQREVDIYFMSLRDFVRQHSLGSLIGPVDHVAFKTASTSHYEKCIEQFQCFAPTGNYVEMSNRRLATLELDEHKLLSCTELGQTRFLEVMEPKPDKANVGFSGLEHAEIFKQNLEAVKKELDHQGVIYSVSENPYHTTVVVKINQKGQEIKFTNRGLEKVIKEQSRKGEVKSL